MIHFINAMLKMVIILGYEVEEMDILAIMLITTNLIYIIHINMIFSLMTC